MSSIIIQLTVSRVKSDEKIIYAVCPFCDHYSKSYHGFRSHLAYFHSNEIGISEVRKNIGKLYRVYQRGLKNEV